MLKANKPLPRPLSPKARPRARSTTSKEHDEHPPVPVAAGCGWEPGAAPGVLGGSGLNFGWNRPNEAWGRQEGEGMVLEVGDGAGGGLGAGCLGGV